jgi:translation initiation factor IF-3
MGIKLLQNLAAEVNTLGAVESTPSIDGRNMVMVIGPLKTKADVKTEAKKAAEKASNTKTSVAEATETETGETNA